jgi:transcriptional regulator with XRE-family HTH domain
MATTLNDKMKKIGAQRRKKIEKRAAELIAEELSLRDLREAREKTQVAVAKELGIGQEGISRIEKRSDLMLSTLRGYVEAMGGELRLIAEFPDRPPVQLQGLAVMNQANKAARSQRARRTSRASAAKKS